jgi:hypothetical protein
VNPEAVEARVAAFLRASRGAARKSVN